MTNIVNFDDARKAEEKKRNEYEAKLNSLINQRQQNIEQITNALYECKIDRATMNIVFDFALALLNSSRICRLEEEQGNSENSITKSNHTATE